MKNNFQKKNQTFLQICPTIDPFLDFGAKKNFKLIFLKKVIGGETLFSPLCSPGQPRSKCV